MAAPGGGRFLGGALWFPAAPGRGGPELSPGLLSHEGGSLRAGEGLRAALSPLSSAAFIFFASSSVFYLVVVYWS